MSLLHASTVAFGREGGVLIRGAAGAGKSTLALRLIAEGAQLVADDRTLVTGRGGQVFARAPGSIAGLIEARGIGILRLPSLRMVRLRLVVDLDSAPERMPSDTTCHLEGVTLSRLPAPAGDVFPAALRHYVEELSRKA